MSGDAVFAQALSHSNMRLMICCAMAFSLSNDDKSVIDFSGVMKSKGDEIRSSDASKIVHAIAYALADPVNVI